MIKLVLGGILTQFPEKLTNVGFCLAPGTKGRRLLERPFLYPLYILRFLFRNGITTPDASQVNSGNPLVLWNPRAVRTGKQFRSGGLSPVVLSALRLYFRVDGVPNVVNSNNRN